MKEKVQGEPEKIIAVEDLVKKYGNLTAVNNISFSINEGEVFAFLGPNGAGKTTTVEMIEMIRTPTSGSIHIFGKLLESSKAEVRERIGVLPQDFRSFERLTVRETLLYYQSLYNGKGWDVDDIISILDLGEKKDVQYRYLSGGLKQRVGVGIAIVNDPDIIFLDEPTTGLDPRARREVWEVIRLLRRKGKTVFLTTHYMEEAEQLADIICIIHKGKIIASGTLEQLIEEYGSNSIMTVSGCNPAEIGELVKASSMDSKEEGGDCLVTLPDNQAVFRILSAIEGSSAVYNKIDIRRSNLEEVFLTLTGESLGGEEDAS